MARQRGRLWLGATSLVAIAYVAAEVAALIWVAGEIGWWTLLILLLTSLLGIYLMQREWRKTWGALSESLRSGQLPSGQMADASLILVGGLLLILPGLLSDIAGALLLLPFTRPFIRSAISWWAARALRNGGATATVIKGETVDVFEPPIPSIDTPNQQGQNADGDHVVVEGLIIEPDDER